MNRPRGVLEDGYYLSAYLTQPGLPFLLSTATRHDNSLALWSKQGTRVELVHYWELERLSGIKHHGFGARDVGHAREIVATVLRRAGIALADIRQCWGTPGIVEGTLDASRLYQHLSVPFHSVCHLLSACLLDGPARSDRVVLGFAVDGGPDFDLDRRELDYWYAGGILRSSGLEVFPVESPAPIYHNAAGRYGMEEGTLMALAEASAVEVPLPGLRDEVLRSARFLNRRAYGEGSAIVEEIDRAVRKQITAGDEAIGLTAELTVVSVAMKEIQRLCESIMQRNVERALVDHSLVASETDLALAGGFSLNCPANSMLMERFGFRKLLAPPCVNDSGQSLGIGLAGFWADLGENMEFSFPGAYLGDDVRESTVIDVLDRFDRFIEEVRPASVEEAAEDCSRQPIVWLRGRSEIGPRALGNRSLIADPTQLRLKDELNSVKGRQSWRPVAPVVREEDAAEWFVGARRSPFMLETFRGEEITRDRAPSVLHLDGSARIQTVGAADNPDLYALLSAFAERTGVPILCNTSLNDKGEPIIQEPNEAVTFALRKGIRVAYLGGMRVSLRPGVPVPEQPAARPLGRLFAGRPGDREALCDLYNPHGLDELYLQLWLRVPELRQHFDPSDRAQTGPLRAAADRWRREHPGDLSWFGHDFSDRHRVLRDLRSRGLLVGAQAEVS